MFPAQLDRSAVGDHDVGTRDRVDAPAFVGRESWADGDEHGAALVDCQQQQQERRVVGERDQHLGAALDACGFQEIGQLCGLLHEVAWGEGRALEHQRRTGTIEPSSQEVD